MSVWAVIVAGGSGTRMGMPVNKALAPLAGKTVLERSLEAFDGLVDGAVVVYRAQDEDAVRALNLRARLVPGGETRQASVLSGLYALPQDAEIALIHDAARPFVRAETIRACIESAKKYGSGVAAVPVTDTIKRAGQDGVVRETLPREQLWAMQTPQAFRPQELRRAIETLTAQGEAATDDARAMEACGHSVRLVEGNSGNIKLTRPEDMELARLRLGESEGRAMQRVGHGYDAHRLVEGRKLVLCGVEIPYEKGLLGHSDADVALHALMDAMLGALALGDIGHLFPDSDPAYAGADSMALLGQVVQRIREKGMRPLHIDATIIAQRPKMAPHIDAMRGNIAAVCGICVHQVGVKATTTEDMNDEGRGLCISAQAIASVV